MAEGPTTAKVSDCVVLAKIPDGPLSAEHFASQTEEVPEPDDRDRCAPWRGSGPT